jgi:type IX secretion system PorP/SprF family membrane protein
MLVLAATVNLVAQDIHFSQYKAAPLYLNPAQAGFTFSKLRVTAVQRSQWRSVSVPFNTFCMGLDFKLWQDRQSKNVVGAGVMAYYDQAGDSRFGTSSVAGAISWFMALNDYQNHYISFGLSGSYNDRSYDYSKLVFGNQFQGDKFNSGYFNGETFLNRGYRFADFNAGVHWYFRPEDDYVYEAGLVLSHISTPPQSMLNDASVLLDRKITLYFNAEITQPDKRVLTPGIYLSRQGTYTEIITGAMVSLNGLTPGRNLTRLQAGLYVRPVDAAILVFGFDYRQVTFGVSYDVNYSRLLPASTMRGGFELSALYMLHKKKKKKPGSIPCPQPF